MRKQKHYRKGDSVRVKAGIPCPDAPDLDISGWQGRIFDLSGANQPSQPVIGIAWDSHSLRAMPIQYIEESERNNLNWTVIYLGLDDIEPAPPRDSEQDVVQTRDKIEARVGWLGIGPEGERIQAIVNAAESPRDGDVLLAWNEYLGQNLKFPFMAEVDEFQERGPLRSGDQVKVLGITMVDHHFGIIVSCRKGRRRIDFPLADLAAIIENSPNTDAIQEYRVWFANR
jgi:hypothetical protein